MANPLYKFSAILKNGQKFTNNEPVTQHFVDTLYNAIRNNDNMVIQVAMNKKHAVMIPSKNIDYYEIKII